ncbi:Proteophosphoglycan ppg4 [Rhodotorula diobovata]|uniref:Proteophosphoglycan ppg4 n=1 Tax=Rhodotorula diobovata TaxID=5288 RepID=A0A5C5FXJ8_9BASI|nr:Proteophosphoglycan ppg4 [Rhodotorula diobovata]
MASLAPPPASSTGKSSNSSNEKGHRNLQVPAPAPASSRPVKQPNQLPLLNLVKVPLRVLSPPKATGMVGSVRSLKATPLNDVRLADVIANKHLSPLSLKDFEGYLVFKEYSAENLYFILWLNEYEKEYRAYLADPAVAKEAPAVSTLEPSTDPLATRTASHLPDYLAESLRRGLDVFFAPDGPLELNLPRATRDKTLVEAGSSGDPRDFSEARDIVEHSLNRSLAQHAKSCVANAGPRRLVFCFCLGLSIFLLGLVPPLVAILTNHTRGYRVIGLPFIAFGTAVMVMALNRICGVIWLLGEDRQLLPWELAAPTVTSGSIVPIACPTTPSSSYAWEDESSYGGSSSADDKDASFRTQTSANPYPWEKQDETTYAVELPPQSSSASSRPPSYRSHGASSRGVVPDSAPVWGPVTAVFSPDVARAQWRLAVYALCVGVVALIIVGVPLMAVPNKP